MLRHGYSRAPGVTAEAIQSETLNVRKPDISIFRRDKTSLSGRLHRYTLVFLRTGPVGGCSHYGTGQPPRPQHVTCRADFRRQIKPNTQTQGPTCPIR